MVYLQVKAEATAGSLKEKEKYETWPRVCSLYVVCKLYGNYEMYFLIGQISGLQDYHSGIQ